MVFNLHMIIVTSMSLILQSKLLSSVIRNGNCTIHIEIDIIMHENNMHSPGIAFFSSIFSMILKLQKVQIKY
jgi:hypothetical protein